MQLHTLIQTTRKRKKRVGQGHGSGRVKTSGRGTKGQKARGKIPLQFEGGGVTLLKRLPFMRGKGRNASYQNKPIELHFSDFKNISKKQVIDGEYLVKEKMLSKGEIRQFGVKLLGNGTISTALTIKIPLTKKAAEKIQKAGGTIEKA